MSISLDSLRAPLSQQIPTFPPIPASVESLEGLMHELYELSERDERRGIKFYSFAAKAEQAWNEALSQKLDEERSRLNSYTATEGFVSKISNLCSSLCLAAEGIVMLITQGPDTRSLAAIAVGGLLAVDSICDAALDVSAKKYLAQLLQRTTNESEQEWLERITTTCALVSIGLGVALPGTEGVQLASIVAQGVLESTKAGVKFSSDRLEANILELQYSMEFSGRNMQSLSRSVTQLHNSPHDQMKQLMQLQESNIDTIESICT